MCHLQRGTACIKTICHVCTASTRTQTHTQVGGLGLTLTAADRVVIVDPSWNPAGE